MEIMGHSSYSVTLSYTHLLDDMLKREVEKVGNFFEVSTSVQTEFNVANDSFFEAV